MWVYPVNLVLLRQRRPLVVLMPSSRRNARSLECIGLAPDQPPAQYLAGRQTPRLPPSIVALVDTLRTDNTLTYALTLSVPFTRQGDVNQFALLYSNNFSYAGHYALSELTTMDLGAGFTETPM